MNTARRRTKLDVKGTRLSAMQTAWNKRTQLKIWRVIRQDRPKFATARTVLPKLRSSMDSTSQLIQCSAFNAKQSCVISAPMATALMKNVKNNKADAPWEKTSVQSAALFSIISGSSRWKGPIYHIQSNRRLETLRFTISQCGNKVDTQKILFLWLKIRPDILLTNAWLSNATKKDAKCPSCSRIEMRTTRSVHPLWSTDAKRQSVGQ